MVVQCFEILGLRLRFSPCVPIVIRECLWQRGRGVIAGSEGGSEDERFESGAGVFDGRVENGEGAGNGDVDGGGPCCKGVGEGGGGVDDCRRICDGIQC